MKTRKKSFEEKQKEYDALLVQAQQKLLTFNRGRLRKFLSNGPWGSKKKISPEPELIVDPPPVPEPLVPEASEEIPSQPESMAEPEVEIEEPRTAMAFAFATQGMRRKRNVSTRPN
jgi:hypothetical protein